MSGRSIKCSSSSLRKNKTEPDKMSRFHASEIRGPFKYEPLQNISHPIQPDDDVSVRDPTLRTVDKSKLSQSIYQNNSGQMISLRSRTPFSEAEESPFMLTFPQKLQESMHKKNKSKLIMYFIDRMRKRFKIDSKAKQFQYLFDKENNSKDNYWTLLPSSWILKCWNIIYYLILHLMLIYIPLSTAFNIQDLNYIFLVLKFMDVVIQLCSSFPQNGQFITNFKSISIRYNKQLLLHDSITLIGLIFLNTLVVNFRFLLLTGTLLSLIKRFYEIELHLKFEFNLFHPIVQVINSIIKMFLVIHVITCYQYGLFNQDHEQFTSYLSTLNMIIQIYSFNSNYVPNEQKEQLFNCLITFSAIIMFAYFLTQFVYLFKKNRMSEQLSEFLAINKLDSNLKLKITNHILNQPKFYHNQFVSKLSGQLLQEFNYVQRSQLLTKYFKFYNQHTINTLINYCEDMICQPNQIIITEQEYDDCSLYFILEGNFKVINKMGIQLQILGSTQTFGEISFYTQLPRSATVISEGVCRLLRIRREIFLNLLTFSDKQYFYNVKDRILIHNDLPNQCFCCNQGDHLISKCPLLTYRPDREKVIKTFIYPITNHRKQYNRRQIKDIKAFEFLKDAEANQDYLLQLYSDNHFQSSNQFSQSNLPYDDVHIKESYASAQSFSRVSRERSLLKSTSLLKEKSLYEQQQSQINDAFLESAENKYIVHQGEMDDDKFLSLVRKDQQKNTFATAGFGNLAQQSIKDQKSLNIIIENESSENSPSLDNDLELTNQPQRNKDPKLTFNYNFDNQMNELQNKYQLYQRNASESFNNSVLRQDNRQTSIRQNSSRSQTYSPITSNNITANSYRSQIKQNENTQTPSAIPRKSTNSNYTLKSVPGINRQYTDSPELQSRKGTNRKKSTKTGTKVSIAPSQFQPFSGFENPIGAEFGDNDFEKLYLFDVYLPYNNYDIVISKFNQFTKQKKLKKLSKYFLSFKLAVQIQKLKTKQFKK
ncbi:unnamed protein product [Paramecium sonneborni]|uniref:Cyclic nucleotide-binding domain-containing protein n=1 Tax=Paramecium sonneborni TaxID=65129 RepID=A0A8S1JUA8_9CILI|nr:unnamed protein product [Paramecium sonneborni]